MKTFMRTEHSVVLKEKITGKKKFRIELFHNKGENKDEMIHTLKLFCYMAYLHNARTLEDMKAAVIDYGCPYLIEIQEVI
ncbi:hypothetical protein [Bacillus coahuilensis]|uniref:hypothetical protein n=1 Tax=Bacillus coahuilensis TaxID=408580 RepID=UPI000185092A|nr:hypothetical protein [Bacillus coahuilensis]